jgi:hypothetical protein
MDLFAWTSTSYLLASTTMVPIYGKLSDSIGRKTVLLTGIAIFLAGSVLCGLARSMLALVIFRGVQGLGGVVPRPDRAATRPRLRAIRPCRDPTEVARNPTEGTTERQLAQRRESSQGGGPTAEPGGRHPRSGASP